MHYIIDGHNLIPKLDGMTLTDLDDEKKLINIIQSFLRKNRGKADLYFDGALLGHDIKEGHLQIHFVSRLSNADNSIMRQIQRIQKTAQHYCVVTSDNRIKNEAQRVGTRIMNSKQFAEKLETKGKKPLSQGNGKKEIDEPETEYWLNRFDQEKL